MIIDFHAHCFPDALAPRALQSLQETRTEANLSEPPQTNGTSLDTEKVLRGAGIDGAVICNIATNERQLKNVNSFAISLKTVSVFFFPLGSLHPDSAENESELDRLSAAGIRGVKLHPDYVKIPITDARFDAVFSLLEERGFFAVIHAGYDPISPNLQHATPKMISKVVKNHPNLKLVAAHTGGFKMSGEVLSELVGSTVYIDTSLSSEREDEWNNLHKIIKEHDSSRILFGTDTPWSNAKREVAFIENAPIRAALREKIFSENAKALLGIK